MKEYRVLTQADSLWTEKFNASTLEAGLNRMAREGWEVKAITSGDTWGLGGKRNEMVVILERDVPGGGEKKEIVSSPDYDASRIPKPRYYQHLGRVSSDLVRGGLVDEEQLDRARMEMAQRGGHLLDHVLALGFVSDEEMRVFLRERFGVSC